MPRFFHFSPSIVEYDAIGYSIRALDGLLRGLGHASFLFCQDAALRISVRDAYGISSLLSAEWRRDDILIFHHSFFSDALPTLLDIPIRKIMVYHNITPGRFFRDANMGGFADACDAGRAQLFSARAAIDAAVSASEYSAAELREIDYSNCRVIPVFYDDAFFGSREMDWQRYSEIRSAGAINIVFIGRLVPNKRPDKLIQLIAEYRKLFRQPIILHLVGKIWDQSYTAGLMDTAARLGVLDAIRMHVAIPPMEVKTLLAAADAFVSFSEHEGFMVPLVEAFTVGCPVIAYRAAAIPETIGKAGIGLDSQDPAIAAGVVELLRRDRTSRTKLIEEQAARAMQFRTEVTAQLWLDLLQDQFGVSRGSGR